MNANAEIVVVLNEVGWVAFPVGGYDEWHEFYDITMTRSEVMRAAKAECRAACP